MRSADQGGLKRRIYQFGGSKDAASSQEIINKNAATDPAITSVSSTIFFLLTRCMSDDNPPIFARM